MKSQRKSAVPRGRPRAFDADGARGGGAPPAFRRGPGDGSGESEGGLTVRGALACGEQAEAIRQELAVRRIEGEQLIRHRLERAKAEGDLPPEANPSDLARYVATVYQGMSVQAAGVASRQALRRVVEIALRAWPEPGSCS